MRVSGIPGGLFRINCWRCRCLGSFVDFWDAAKCGCSLYEGNPNTQDAFVNDKKYKFLLVKLNFERARNGYPRDFIYNLNCLMQFGSSFNQYQRNLC